MTTRWPDRLPHARPLRLPAHHAAARLRVAERRAAGGVHRLQHRTLRLRRRAGRMHRPGLTATRRAQPRLARVRQPRRRVALPGAVRRARAAHRRARQHRAVRPLPRAGPGAGGARRRADRPRPQQCRAPGRARRRRTNARCCSAAANAWCARAGRHPPAGSRHGSRKAPSRPTCWPRPATATRSTGATTTSRCACAHAAAARCGRCRIRRSSTTSR